MQRRINGASGTSIILQIARCPFLSHHHAKNCTLIPEHQLPAPTDGELEILQVLWGRAAEPVRYVNETINGRRAPEQQVGYTTTLKQMQIMLDKGLLSREINRPQPPVQRRP